MTDPLITGTGICGSLAVGVEGFAAALRAGTSAVAEQPAAGGGCEWAAPLAEFDLAARLAADPRLPEPFARAARRVAGRSPLPVRAALLAAAEAWVAAGLLDRPVPAERIGLVVAGNNLNGRYADQLSQTYRDTPEYLPPRAALQLQDTDHVGVLSQLLGIRGEGMTVGGASASGNLALIAAARLIEWDALDACLVIGAMSDLSPLERQAYRGIGAMCDWNGGTPPGVPFDRDHRGFVPGQSAAAVLLESPASASRRGAPAQARIAGYASRLAGNSLSDPGEDEEAEVIRTALGRAGIGPARLDYVNSHGTGSPLGDATEARALRRALGESAGRPWLNATKSLTGHCLGAAGVVEAVACVVQLREGFVHPNPRLCDPIDGCLRFVPEQAQPARLGFALSNSFGFGGFHSAVLLAGAKPSTT